MNDIERIRESFKTLPIELSYDKLLVAAEKFHPIAVVDEYRRKIETSVATCSQEIIEKISQILSKVTHQHDMQLKQHLFHLLEAPESSSLQEIIQPLLQFIETKFLVYKDRLIRQNFIRSESGGMKTKKKKMYSRSIRLLELVWAMLIDQLLVEVEHATTPVRQLNGWKPRELNVCLSRQRTMSSHTRLSKALESLMEYFNADEQCLTKEMLKTDKYKVRMIGLSLFSFDKADL